MANPRPTAAQVGFIAAGAIAGAILSFGILGIGGMVGGAIIGAGAGVGAIPYSLASQRKKKDGDG